MSEQAKLPEGATEAIAEILCAWDYRDDSGQTWETLSDVGRDGFRIQAVQLAEGTMPGRVDSALSAILAQRDAEWRERLLGDEAMDAAYRAFAKRGNQGADSFRPVVAAALQAALDKAAPDGGRE